MENFPKTTSTTEDESQGGNKSSDFDEENLEWFEDDVKIMLLRQSVSEIQELKKNNDLVGKKDIEYCFSAVSKAIPANKKKQTTENSSWRYHHGR